MEGLQRSAVSFKRQGSSAEINRFNQRKKDDEKTPLHLLRKVYHTGKVSQAIDPPSPKVEGGQRRGCYEYGGVNRRWGRQKLSL
ncbi:hypothetical protein DCAR_0728829 [Daucus carota subsp. sativus]|uniref:Uncharacterized protein n=1 Tax=Daucus carota subsp. sativus TaxID=79200 RepID=A0AAF0XLQ5_DAUCS|nr:hypothetical protein DCAR_0728829 [Daucus carota subsp. sativus]